jgi:uncharacterized membrane protein
VPEEPNRTADNSELSRLDRLVEEARHRREIRHDGSEDTPPQAEAVVARMLRSEAYSGAFAHPSILASLNEVVHDGAERAFAMTEREQQHRHDCDNRALDAEIDDAKKSATDRRIVIFFLMFFVTAAVASSFLAALFERYAAAGVSGAVGVAIAIAGLVKLAPTKNNKDSAVKEDPKT